MFLHELGRQQQHAFVDLAHRIIELDDHLAEQKKQTMELLRREMDLSAVLEDGDGLLAGPSASTTEVFETRKERAIVLLELLLLALADGELHQAEKQILQSIARDLDVSDEELETMQNWALREVALAQEASEFWTDEAAATVP